jgi:hypothetical protein
MEVQVCGSADDRPRSVNVDHGRTGHGEKDSRGDEKNFGVGGQKGENNRGASRGQEAKERRIRMLRLRA